MAPVEYNDIYDKDRNLTGRVHCRGSSWKKGEYGLVVCVWVYDGKGKILLTRRASGKTVAGTWENSGGAVIAGEDSRTAIARELFEETGIRADKERFELLDSCTDGKIHYDHYCLRCQTPLEDIVLQPGETDAAQWVDFEQIHQMIARKEICYVIGKQFRRHEKALLARQDVQK